MNTIRVLVVDDHQLIARGLCAMLAHENDIAVIEPVFNGHDALRIAQREQPDVVVLDVQLPDLDGVAVTQQLRKLCPGCGVLLLTGYDDDEYIFEGMRAGAQGYLLKNAAEIELAEYIRHIARGTSVLDPQVIPKVFAYVQQIPPPVVSARSASLLSEREQEVLYHIARGLTNNQIAVRLGVTLVTIKSHLNNLYKKLETHNRKDVIEEARKRGLL